MSPPAVDKLRKYVSILKTALDSESRTKFSISARIVLTNIELAIYFYIWSYILTYSAQGNVFGYGLAEMVGYYTISIFIGNMTTMINPSNLSTRARLGSIVIPLTRPVGIVAYYMARYLGMSLRYILASFVTMLVWLLFAKTQVSMAGILFTMLLLPFIAALRTAISIILASTIFWTEENWGIINYFKEFLIPLVSGGYFPLEFFPEQARLLIGYLPFHFLAYTPTALILGKTSPGTVLSLVPFLVLWTLALCWLANRMWSKGLAKFNGYGG